MVPDLPRLVQLTGAQDLRNLEATGELNLADLLLTASDAVFDRLVVDGINPGALSNPEVYERAVAFQFLALLAVEGDMGGESFERLLALADRFYQQVRAHQKRGNLPRRAGEALPRVMNTELPERRLL